MAKNKIIYNGNTLIDLTEDTVTAETLMQGYTAHDRSGALITGTATSGGTGAISVVDTEDTHGGTIRTITAVDISDTTAVADDVAQGKYFYTADGTKTAGTSTGGGGDTWNWMGKNPTKVSTPLSEKVYLKDTGYATWTPTTTSSVIVSNSVLTPVSVNLSDYDYIVYYDYHMHFEYDSTAEQASLINDIYTKTFHSFFPYVSNLQAFTTGVYNNAGYFSGTSNCNGVFYKNTSGADSLTTSATNGVYMSLYGPKLISLTSITLQHPVIYARCNSNQFSTTSASAVDQEKSYYELVMGLYQVDGGTSILGQLLPNLRDMWLQGDII